MNEQAGKPRADIITVKELLADKNLSIPLYQRPYKWTVKNVNQLFKDIANHKNKSAYRLGTIVFHEENGKKNIVDGQQRIITLLLAIIAMSKLYEKDSDRKHLKNLLEEANLNIPSFNFKNKISKANIYNNYQEINRIIRRSDFAEQHIKFLLYKCEFVTFTLNNISEAFQFFDSQNARGRDLEPHDLLKAYHLRELNTGEGDLKIQIISKWENSETEELAVLFSEYLYRIRNWSNGYSARYFTKNDVDLFKGVNIEASQSYPYIKQSQIAHLFIDNYNQQIERKIDAHNMDFPFQVDQLIINGRRFFEMIAYYQEMISGYKKHSKDKTQIFDKNKLDGYAKQILKILDEYDGRHRSGDRYVRTIFDCLLIYYIDKFGEIELSRAIEKIFIWSYSLRLKMQMVKLASTDNYVLDNNLFKLIKHAVKPNDFIHFSLPNLEEVKSTKNDDIKNLFKEMAYYDK